MKRTTVLSELRGGDEFIWGDIIEFYHIAEYNIASYHPWKVQGVRVLTGEPDTDIVFFHCWVNGNDTNQSTESLDSAIAFCIAYKHEGGNTKAAGYFMKMIASKVKE
mgnify:CR=1 FL=1